jgi:hypothetical protein
MLPQEQIRHAMALLNLQAVTDNSLHRILCVCQRSNPRRYPSASCHGQASCRRREDFPRDKGGIGLWNLFFVSSENITWRPYALCNTW